MQGWIYLCGGPGALSVVEALQDLHPLSKKVDDLFTVNIKIKNFLPCGWWPLKVVGTHGPVSMWPVPKSGPVWCFNNWDLETCEKISRLVRTWDFCSQVSRQLISRSRPILYPINLDIKTKIFSCQTQVLSCLDIATLYLHGGNVRIWSGIFFNMMRKTKVFVWHKCQSGDGKTCGLHLAVMNSTKMLDCCELKYCLLNLKPWVLNFLDMAELCH